MKKTVIGILVATIAMYLWGFAYWGLPHQLPYAAWQSTGDDEAVQVMLREAFPISGTYYIPSFDNSPEELERLYEAGPVGFVHINLDGRPQVDPTIMVGGIILNLVVVATLAVLFTITRAREFREFVRITLVTGVLAVILIDLGDAVWWQTPLAWKLWQAFYNFSALLVAGHVLAAFMKRAPDPA